MTGVPEAFVSCAERINHKENIRKYRTNVLYDAEYSK